MPEQPEYTKRDAQRSFGLQLAMALAIGSSSLLLFSFWRRKWPHMYEVRTYRNMALPPLNSSLFGWIRQVVHLKGHDVLRYAGLDAYFYLAFFQLATDILWRLSLVALFFIAPMRMYNWWHGKEDDDDSNSGAAIPKTQMFDGYSWVFLATTYIFTLICLYMMRQYNTKVISIRQAYLGHQNSVTDRTLRISGIPKKLRSEEALMKYVTILFGVEPESVSLCRQWETIDRAFTERKKLVRKLELVWTDYIGPDNEVFKMDQFDDVDDSEFVGDLNSVCERLFPDRKRPVGKISWFSDKRVDLLDYYGQQLADIDRKIVGLRSDAHSQPSTNMAFVTMKTVAHCQLAAQSKFSPRSHTMVNSLAPAPTDVIWKNVYMKPKERSLYSYCIALIVLITNVFLAYILYYVATLLNHKYIDTHFPWFGKVLQDHKWVSAVVTGILPTYLVPSFNLVIPYFFAWLSVKQGTVSKSDAQLSTISKNFFYVFVSLFLVFTVESAALSLSVDKLAKDFAQYLKPLSWFYTNLIILQGIGLSTFRLIQGGTLFQFTFLLTKCRTAREHYDLYKPQTLNYGLFLPMPLLFFILTLTYSIMSLRILFFGLVYFALNWFVFKYQLLYSMVYHHHSTGQLWSIIIRRMYLGIAVFHLAMSGVLVLRSNYTFAVMIVPLSVCLGGFWYDFERFSSPLLQYVAIEALRQRDIDANNMATYDIDGGSPTDLPSVLWGESASTRVPTTLDELREENRVYAAEVLTDPLDGPWVAANAFECVVANRDGFYRRQIPQAEWL